tara:strand:- start:217 stop:573 length:357 start_codon:yes stop_codon:yes gene_type:complete
MESLSVGIFLIPLSFLFENDLYVEEYFLYQVTYGKIIQKTDGSFFSSEKSNTSPIENDIVGVSLGYEFIKRFYKNNEIGKVKSVSGISIKYITTTDGKPNIYGFYNNILYTFKTGIYF